MPYIYDRLTGSHFSMLLNFSLIPNFTMYNLTARTAFSLPLLLLLSLLSVLHFYPSHNASLSKTHLHVQTHLQVAHTTCQGTLYPQPCVSTLSSISDLSSKSVQQIISSVISHTVSEVKSTSHNFNGLQNNLKNLNRLQQRALEDCLKLFDDTVYELDATVAYLSSAKIGFKRYSEVQNLLSGAMTNMYTCLDGFAYSRGSVGERIEDKLFEISRHVSNSLAMLKNVPGLEKDSESDEIFREYGKVKKRYPTWLYSRERNLLEANVNETRFDLVVAKDGTGNFTTIGEAVNAAPNCSTSRIVIHIKAGAYFENVEVIRKKTNLMFIGDGIGKTIVKGSRSVVDGWTTFQSATVAVAGTGFIAKGVTFENSAGAIKHQAVALRNSADLSAFYKCSFVGYQDTLYVHSLRQFYRDCDIYGTIDFIFGNAAALFQNCNLYARKPLETQKNMFTAQGRDDPNQNTGISILNCKIAAAEDLIPVKSSFESYLGRPWKPFSRTVIMKSYVEDVIEGGGWLEWNGTLGLDTLYYREYLNSGPGSNTSDRVRWPGFGLFNSSAEASQFTAARFIQGYDWLNSTDIPFYLDLS